MTLGEKLAKLTEDRKRTVLSRRAGLSACALSTYITRKQMPGADAALRLARVLEVDLTWLLDDKADWPPVRVLKKEDAAMAQGQAA